MPNKTEIKNANELAKLNDDLRRALLFDHLCKDQNDAVSLGGYEVKPEAFTQYQKEYEGKYETDSKAIMEAIVDGKAFTMGPEGSVAPYGITPKAWGKWLKDLPPEKKQTALNVVQKCGLVVGIVCLVIKFLYDRHKANVKFDTKCDPQKALKNYHSSTIAKALMNLANNGKSLEEGEEPDFLAKLGVLLRSLMGEGGLNEEEYNSVCGTIREECALNGYKLGDNDIPEYSAPQNSASKNPANSGGPQQPAAGAAAAPAPVAATT